jgi:hypothetical protein
MINPLLKDIGRDYGSALAILKIDNGFGTSRLRFNPEKESPSSANSSIVSQNSINFSQTIFFPRVIGILSRESPQVPAQDKQIISANFGALGISYSSGKQASKEYVFLTSAFSLAQHFRAVLDWGP